jgi:hypothetical protein
VKESDLKKKKEICFFFTLFPGIDAKGLDLEQKGRTFAINFSSYIQTCLALFKGPTNMTVKSEIRTASE